ncbi:MAG: PqqD family protein [Lachnospiraceae bacterium]
MQRNKEKRTGNYLEYIPVHNPAIGSTVDENGNVTILKENKGFFYFLTQKLLGKPRVSQIHLDKMGNFIWPLMDGNRNVMDIAGLVKEKFGDEAEPLYNRLVTYIDTMERYGFVELILKS